MPASAAIYTITWEGTLDTGTFTLDSNPTVDIAGTAFSVVYTINDSLGITTGSTPPSFVNVFGGPGHGFPASTPVSAVLTLDGIGTFDFAGGDRSSASRVNYDPVSTDPDSAGYQSSDQIDDTTGDVFHHRTSSVFSAIIEGDPSTYGTLFDSIDYDGVPIRGPLASDDSIFAMQWNDILTDLSTGKTRQVFVEGASSNGWIVAAVAAVPEPTSWALMILGFAMVGTRMRRHRVAVAFS